MARIEDFEKRYVTSVHFDEGDKILVTEENIEPLRKALKDKNFEWVSGSQIVEGESFQPNIIISLDEHDSNMSGLIVLINISNIEKLSTMSLLTTKGDINGTH